MTGYAPRRLLGDMIADFAAGAHGLPGGPDGVLTRSIELTLPVEMRVEQRDGDLVFVADVPRFRRRTDFDLPPGRLGLRLEAAS